MFNNLMTKFAAGFGLAFLLIHVAFIYHLAQPQAISSLYLLFWRIFICFFGVSIVYLVHNLIITYFKRSTSILSSTAPLLINVTVFILIYGISFLKAKWQWF